MFNTFARSFKPNYKFKRWFALAACGLLIVCTGIGLGLGHYIILNNGILKLYSSIFPRSEGYITQYTP